jgi:valyl-tRNA synthetase
MSLPKKYDPKEVEPRIESFWQETGVFQFDLSQPGEVYSIDTPPPTVSGLLHLGHVYSYSHTDFIARFRRMQGYRVFYPMGFDDNGLPTERYVEKHLGKKAKEIGRQEFIEKCLEIGAEAEKEYRSLWKRLGLSIDWRYSYRTIDSASRRIAQQSFIDLFQKGLAFHEKSPAIWCPECQASIAQADLDDLDQESEFLTLAFQVEGGGILPIATTRPELLPACVAIFVHPGDGRFKHLVGAKAITPLFQQVVPILEDPLADPEKGTGAVMCCTFGDSTDVGWWHKHGLKNVQVIGRDGRMTTVASEYAGLTIHAARRKIKQALEEWGLLLGAQSLRHSVRVHERCDTPVEYVVVDQWFVNILDHKEELIRAGEAVRWIPDAMLNRFKAWVENLNWDWCLSRQRYFGIPFPVWYCKDCQAVILAEVGRLPVDPMVDNPEKACPKCGGRQFIPEEDVMDTWATSSLSPQIVGKWLDKDQRLYQSVFPFSLRPQAHDIIRTWAFYTILKSLYHFNELPWGNVAISGWGIAGTGMGKISKSRGGGPMAPKEMIELYSADAVRYWAASTGPGKDAIISEEKIKLGAKLVTKLWNVARFMERFIAGYVLEDPPPALSPADRWILGRLQRLVKRMTTFLESYDYAAAKSELESFFWTELADNYLEMCKQRLYDEGNPGRIGAIYTLFRTITTVLQLFAPYLPYVTEEIYQNLLLNKKTHSQFSVPSIHLTHWPMGEDFPNDPIAEAIGVRLIEIATAVRRYKSEHNLPLGSELSRVKLAIVDPSLVELLREAMGDLMSITRAKTIEVRQAKEEAIEVEV